MDYKMVLKDFFICDSLSKLVGFFVCFFTVVIFIYSWGFIKRKKWEYYTWFFLTFIAALGVVCSEHSILLIIFWGFLGLTLFQLINLYSDAQTAHIAKKAFIIVGGSDSLLLLGFLIYAHVTSRYLITGGALHTNDTLGLLSFLLIASACFAKAGCMPFHTWIPDTARDAPVPVVAYLPASLDKLLGIYLLARIAKDSFILDARAKIILLIAGAITIIGAVMMALIQHNIKKLLGFHAVSQVGYMVLGIGCASPLGLAGGLFHMLNNALYKSCLFLGAGNVEKQTHTTELKKLGGIGKYMPVTFLVTLTAALAISGIPPLNGFVSKWMVYQGLLDSINTTPLFAMKAIIVLALVAALIGSGLTLASFLKLISGVFLGNARQKANEGGITLLIPPLVLAFLCIIFGIFASATILPLLEKSVGSYTLIGLWKPVPATMLIIIGLVLGYLLFKIMTKKLRVSAPFTGGEAPSLEEEAKIADFYNTVKELPLLKTLYALGERKFFDVYEQLKKITFLFVKVLKYLHNGILPTYLVWCLLGMIGLFFIFFK